MIVWHKVTNGLPGSDTIVLLFHREASEPVCSGYSWTAMFGDTRTAYRILYQRTGQTCQRGPGWHDETQHFQSAAATLARTYSITHSRHPWPLRNRKIAS
jgi:hypothetical protein